MKDYNPCARSQPMPHAVNVMKVGTITGEHLNELTYLMPNSPLAKHQKYQLKSDITQNTKIHKYNCHNDELHM